MNYERFTRAGAHLGAELGVQPLERVGAQSKKEVGPIG
jgi:hypothetical protein